MSRNSSKCSSCNAKSVKTATAAAMAVAAAAATVAKQHLNPMDEILPHFDVNNKKSFVCKWCDRTFGSSSNLKRHIMIHTGWLHSCCYFLMLSQGHFSILSHLFLFFVFRSFCI